MKFLYFCCELHLHLFLCTSNYRIAAGMREIVSHF